MLGPRRSWIGGAMNSRFGLFLGLLAFGTVNATLRGIGGGETRRRGHHRSASQPEMTNMKMSLTGAQSLKNLDLETIQNISGEMTTTCTEAIQIADTALAKDHFQYARNLLDLDLKACRACLDIARARFPNNNSFQEIETELARREADVARNNDFQLSFASLKSASPQKLNKSRFSLRRPNRFQLKHKPVSPHTPMNVPTFNKTASTAYRKNKSADATSESRHSFVSTQARHNLEEAKEDDHGNLHYPPDNAKDSTKDKHSFDLVSVMDEGFALDSTSDKAEDVQGLDCISFNEENQDRFLGGNGQQHVMIQELQPSDNPDSS